MKRLRNIGIGLFALLLSARVAFAVPADSVPSLAPDSVPATWADSTRAEADSLLQEEPMLPGEDTVRYSDAVDARIDYKTSDSLVIFGNGTAFLHGKGDITYRDINLTADYVRLKLDSSTLFAAGVYDTTTEEWTGRPVFKDGKDSYESYEMSYNMQTKKAFIRHVVTEQGEGYIIADRTKKGEGDEMMMAGGRYTTCDEHDHPHFYLALTKAKVKPGESVVTGPAYLVVGDVPLPLAVPFGFFPFNDTYSSGLIMPTFGDDYSRGLYLNGLGYYFALSDYADLELTGDIYTRGTWAIRARSAYRLRYKFSGNLSLNFRQDVTGEKDMPDYTKSTNFSVNWTHQQDSKANPYSNFSASVNFSTSGYNRSNIQSYYNSALNSENTKSSSISYTQRFPESPWSISMTARIDQRTKDSTISLTLPDLSVNMSQIYPFKRKNPVGKAKWYEKISMRYTMNSKIAVTDKEKHLLHSDFLRDWQTGVKHSIPLSASFTLFKYLTISPSINYNERWYFQREDLSWDEEQNMLHRDTTNGFFRIWDMSMGVSMQTKLYVFLIPSRKLFPNGRVDRFRNVITPNISFSYSPDCESIRAKLNHNYWGEYTKPVTNSAGEVFYETVQYNRFSKASQMYGMASRGNVGSLNFSVANNLEMKVFNRKDTTGKDPTKIISLIDNFSISGGYNFMADSMNWSNFQVNLRIKLPKPLNYTINLSGAFDPYTYTLNAAGNPVRWNRRCWQEGKFLHFKGTSTSFSYTFNNETFRKWFNKDKDKNKKDEKFDPGFDMDDPYAVDRETGELITEERRKEAKKQEQEWKRKHKGGGSSDSPDGWEFAEIPWSLSINYNIRYGESSKFDYDKMNYKMEFTHYLSGNISLGLGRGWKATTSLSYDFKAKKLSNATINVTRDLHCWTLSGSFVPFGPYKSYTMHIGVNASMLSDLKYDKSSTDSTNKRVDWW